MVSSFCLKNKKEEALNPSNTTYKGVHFIIIVNNKGTNRSEVPGSNHMVNMILSLNRPVDVNIKKKHKIYEICKNPCRI